MATGLLGTATVPQTVTDPLAANTALGAPVQVPSTSVAQTAPVDATALAGAPATPTATPTTDLTQPPTVQATQTAAPAAPADTTTAPATATTDPNNRVLKPEETVAGQLNTLLSGDSTYIQSARNKGLEQANSRGLLNSSLAAGTAERAAIDAASPIATADANIYANAAQAAQNANINSNLQSQKAAQDSALAAQNADATYKLNADMKQMGIDADKEMKQMDIDYNLQALSSTSRDNFTKAVGSINQQFLDGIKTIYATPNLTPEVRDIMVNNMRTERDASLKSTAAAASFTIDMSGISNSQPTTGGGDSGTTTTGGTGGGLTPTNQPTDPANWRSSTSPTAEQIQAADAAGYSWTGYGWQPSQGFSQQG